MIRRLAAIVVLLGAGAGLLLPLPAAAAIPSQLKQAAVCGGTASDFLGLEPWYSCIQDKTTGSIQIKQLNDVWLIALTIIEDVIKLGMYIAAGFIIWGGIKYIKSQGDPGQAAEGKKIITNALMGLLFSLLSVAIVQFIAGGIK